jgi:ankyrin repeat protein
MLSSIQATPYRRDVTTVLQILLWSGRRLTLEQCNDAIIVRPGETSGFSADNRFFDPFDIVSICSGLVTTVWARDIRLAKIQYLQLSHASVQEYLSSQEVIQSFQTHLGEREAKAYLIRLCHTYLSCIDWSAYAQSKEFDHAFPLAIWAVYVWPKHARYLEAFDDDVRTSVLRFLQQACMLSNNPFRYIQGRIFHACVDTTQLYPLYLAALMGFQRSSRHLIQSELSNMPEKSDEPEDLVHGYLRPTQVSLRPAAIQKRLDASLVIASARRYDTIVQDLLDQGARPDACWLQHLEQSYTALQLASRNGCVNIVRLLIKFGASTDYVVKPCDKTALYLASSSILTDPIVRILLSYGADPEIHSNGWSPLRIAVFNNCMAAAEALISVGANLYSRPIDYDADTRRFRPTNSLRGQEDLDLDSTTLLMLAVCQGYENMAHLLLDNGVSLEDKDSYNQTVLHLAVRSGAITMAKLLLDRGALIDAEGPNGNALVIAAHSGRCDIVQLLLDYGADLSGCKWHGALFAAAHQEHLYIVEQILLHGVHINEFSLLGTALYQAAWYGLETLVKKLLEHGAEADSHEENARTPLQIATAKHHVRVMRLLIEGGADMDRDMLPGHLPCHNPTVEPPSITSNRAWLRWLQIHPESTLHQAGQQSSWQAAEILSRTLTPLQIAMVGDFLGPVIRLIDSGVSPNKGQGLTPLQIAFTMGYQDVVENLLRGGAHLNNSGSDETFSELATRNRLLVKRGASIDLAVQIARSRTDSREIIRSMRCFHTSVRSRPDFVSKGQELDSSLLLDTGILQPSGEHTYLESRDIPSIVVEDCDSDPLNHPLEVPHHDVDPEFGYLGCAPDCLKPEW